MRRRTGVFVAATFLAVCIAPVLGDPIVQNFNSDTAGTSPTDWLDTDQNNLDDYPPAVDYFRVVEVGGEKALGVISGLIDIHSHFVPSGSSTWSVVRFEGRMRADYTNAGVGVTFLSNYPTTDAYYSLVSAPYTGNEFIIDSHGTAVQGDTGSGVVRTNAAWTRYRIDITDTGTQTEIRAKVWLDGDTEPASWQIDSYDNSGTRRTTGTVGAWSMWSSSLCYWDDFTVTIGNEACAFTPTLVLNGGLPAAPPAWEWRSISTVGLASEFDYIPPLTNVGKIFYPVAWSGSMLEWSPEIIVETVRVLGGSMVEARMQSSTHYINGRPLLDWIIEGTQAAAAHLGRDVIPTVVRIIPNEAWLDDNSAWLNGEVADMIGIAPRLAEANMCVTLVYLDQEHTRADLLASDPARLAEYERQVGVLIDTARSLWPNAVISAYGNGNVDWSWAGWIWRELYPEGIDVDAGVCDLYHEDAFNGLNRMVYINSLEACEQRGLSQMVAFYTLDGAYRPIVANQSRFSLQLVDPTAPEDPSCTWPPLELNTALDVREPAAVYNQAWESVFLHGQRLEANAAWPAWGKTHHWIVMGPAGGVPGWDNPEIQDLWCDDARAYHEHRVKIYASLLREFARGAYNKCASDDWRRYLDPPTCDDGPLECVAADVNCDGSVNGLDLATVTNSLNWMHTPFACDRADVNGNGSVNALDLGVIVNPAIWLTTPHPEGCCCVTSTPNAGGCPSVGCR
jgi:hypothetical protein